jgi:hypothetical protein
MLHDRHNIVDHCKTPQLHQFRKFSNLPKYQQVCRIIARLAQKECLVSSIAVTILLLVVVLNIVPVAASATNILAAIVLVIQVVGLLPCLTLCLLLVKVVHALGFS